MSQKILEFENRLRKNFRHIAKWATRQGISCYRIYDADTPSFPFAVDLYGDYISVSEYKTKYSLEGEEHYRWMGECIIAISEVTEIPEKNIFIREREKQAGKGQYEKRSNESFGTWVDELGAKFWVNLTDYLDTGLFLDHRNTRLWVREKSEGKRVLNLFAYTGAFSVHAALGGAEVVTTVDMSKTYLEWAEKNMKKNGFSSPDKYRYLREDILYWLKKPFGELYDIIVMDPPTFSNSKKMKGFLNIQRDHVYLISQAMKLLKKDGLMYFSNNFRNFKIDYEALSKYKIKEVSSQSVPNDFRNKKIHKCFEVRF